MGAMAWLRVRPRTLVGASVVSIAALGIATMAVAYEGNPTTELDLHDGSVWITKAEAGLIGHFNAESQVLDGQLGAPTADYEVLQDGDTVLVHDSGDDTIGRIDTASVSMRDSVTVPDDAVVDYAAQTVAILDRAKGSLYVVPLAGLPSFAVGETKPTLDKLGEGAVVTVGRDGTVFAASAEKGTVHTIPVKPEGDVDKEAIVQQQVEGLDETAELSITSVGDKPALLDATAGVVHLPGQPAFALDEPEDARLALDAADGDAVLVATRTELLSIPLDGSEPAATPSGGLSGRPAEPVWLSGCAYSAWMDSGRFVRDCHGAGDLTSAIDEYKTEGELRFRVNRDVVMLNNVFSGAAWLASDVLQKVDNWDDLTPPKGEGVENPDPTTVEVPNPSPPDRGIENHAPKPNPDRFGARAGASTILPVLSGYGPEGAGADSDPDGDVLVVSLPDAPPAGTQIQAINDGTALQITLDEGTTTVPTFRYQVSDGRLGGVAESTVTIDVRPEDANEPPVQLRQLAVPVSADSSVTYNVLSEWIDPDGDDVYLEAVAAPEGNEVEFTADGRVTYRPTAGVQGLTEINVTVSDGRAAMTGTFSVEVRPPGPTPPLATADHLVVRPGQQGTVSPLANDLSSSEEPLELTQVSQVEDATIVPDLVDDTFTFQASRVGTYYVDYLVAAAGAPPAEGLVRVDVVEPTGESAPPVAVRDVALLPPGGDALVNVLGNDSDPGGGVLVVQGVEVDPASGIAVSVIGHETLRVADAGLSGEGGQVSIRYTISNGVDTATGEVMVLALPKETKAKPPVLNDDSAVVRVGDVVTIPVLENDYDPNDDEFALDPELVKDPEAGSAFVSGDMVRYRASDQPGTVHVTYAAEDSRGERGTAEIAIDVKPMDAENNNAPRPLDIEARTLDGAEATIEVPLDAIDPDGDSVELVGLASAAKQGVATPGATSIAYKAHAGAAGLDTFTYTVRDTQGAEATGTVRIGIAGKAAQNQAPFAVRDNLTMRPGRVVAAPVLENDSDPDGENVGLIQGDGGLILGEDPQVEAEVDGKYVIVTAPEEELETSLQYVVTDEQGARSLGVLQITVDEDAPPVPPRANDDRIRPEEIESGSATISVTANDVDPDGTKDVLVPQIVDPDAGVVVDPDGTATVEIRAERRLVEYTVTDEDDQVGRAFIHVPGEEDLRPAIRPEVEPARVQSGETIELPLETYVRTTDGAPVRITEAEKVSAAHSDGSSLVIDEYTLRYTSADRYSGTDAVTFEVTDGSGPDDPNGRTAMLSIPIMVTPADNEAPEMQGAAVTVGAGDPEPATIDLAGLATDIDQDPVSFEVAEQPEGITAEIVNDTTLRVTADAGLKGTVANVVILADDGQPNPNDPDPVTADIEVTVTASTRPLPVATDDTVAEWNAGQRLTVPVLENDVNPFDGEAPLEVVDAKLETGAAEDAEITSDADSVSITPAGDFHGRLVVRYRIQDSTKDADRVADARVTVTVRGEPDAPGVPNATNVQSREATLRWRPPADNGAAITEYRVTTVKGGTKSWTCPETTCTLTGLTNNVTYAFTVTAVNEVGESKPSPVSGDVRPDVRPDMPAAPQLPKFRDSGLLVTWEAPKTEGSAITKYDLRIEPTPPNGIDTRTVAAGTTQLWWDGLLNGQAYSVSVRAHNLAPKPSDWSPSSTRNTPAKPPAAPAAPAAKRQSSVGATAGGVEVTWNAVTGEPAGGDEVDAYQVQILKGGAQYGELHSTSATRYVVTLPTDRAEYTFRVKAKNKAGWSGWSEPSASLRQFTSPGAPGTPTVTEGDRQVTASWAPATAEGVDASEIRYQYSVNGGAWQEAAGTSATIVGLQNGAQYRVAARAYAVADGTQSAPGPASAQSAAASPYGPPHAPSANAVLSQNGTHVTCSWDASGSANGRPVAVQARFFDGAGWQDVPVSGSRTCADGYNKTGQVEVRATANPGGTASAISPQVRTVDEPKPATAQTVQGADNGAKHAPGCSYDNCEFVGVKVQNFPAGNYRLECHTGTKSNPGGQFGGAETHHLSGNDTAWMNCYYDANLAQKNVVIRIVGWGYADHAVWRNGCCS
ncbi:Ig-like domain-containing protein [Microbacterium paludicola]|uniref:Ig-like domain-containing protein n=1 Tax=Microbacterium paludicola TaxID=300019 RepID=UPI00387A5D63